LEGILVFHDSRLRDLMNMKIFVDTGIPCIYLVSIISILQHC
jgi:uridine kinase